MKFQGGDPEPQELTGGVWRDLTGNWPTVLAIAVLCLISRYWFSSHFGFYEDDYWRIPYALVTPLAHAGAAFWQNIVDVKQGRPLHGAFIGLFASIGGRLDGLHGAYWVGYAISVLNTLLLFTLLRRARVERAISAAAAAAFAVYPGDASEGFLTHALGVQPALTLVLAGMHLWLKGQRLASWVSINLALCCYETPVPLFAAVPLLLPRWNGRQFLRHASGVGLCIAVMAGLRKYFGEDRVSELTLRNAAARTAHNLLRGPRISLTSYVWRPVEMAGGFDGAAIALGILAAGIGWALFLRRPAHDWGRLPRLAAAGLAFLFLSYLLPVILDASYRDGRASRVHFAASVGCAILGACFFGFVAQRFGRFAAASGMALVLGTSTAAGVAVQRDYQRSWQLQRAFWREVVRLCPDLAPGKVIFVDGFPSLPETRHLKVFEWSMPLIPGEIFQFPAGDGRVPGLLLMTPEWRHYLEPDGGILIQEKTTVVWTWYGEPPLHYARSQYIVVQVRDGHLIRPEPPGPPVKFPKGPLYKYLLGP